MNSFYFDFFFSFLIFQVRISFCHSGCPEIHFVDQVGFELTEMALTLAPQFWG